MSVFYWLSNILTEVITSRNGTECSVDCPFMDAGYGQKCRLFNTNLHYEIDDTNKEWPDEYVIRPHCCRQACESLEKEASSVLEKADKKLQEEYFKEENKDHVPKKKTKKVDKTVKK